MPERRAVSAGSNPKEETRFPGAVRADDGTRTHELGHLTHEPSCRRVCAVKRLAASLGIGAVAMLVAGVALADSGLPQLVSGADPYAACTDVYFNGLLSG